MATPKDKKHRIRAGAFLLVATTVLVGAVLVLGRSHNLFSHHITLHTQFDNVSGLIPGSGVRLAGLDIGSVNGIHFDPDTKVRRIDVDLTIGEQYLRRIRTDSIARVSSKGLLGDMIVDVTIGSEDHPELHNGDSLPSVEVPSMTEIVQSMQHAIGGIDHLVSDVDQRVRSLVTPEVTADFARITSAAADVTEGIAHGPGLANALLTRRSLADNADQAVHEVRNAAARIDHAAGEVDRLAEEIRSGPGLVHGLVYGDQAAKLTADVQTSVSNLADATRQLKDGNGSLHSLLYTDDAKSLLAELTEAAHVLRKLTDETDQGKGTVGGLLKDPTAYQDLTQVLGNLKRNELLKAVIRYTISKDGLERPAAAPNQSLAGAGSGE